MALESVVITGALDQTLFERVKPVVASVWASGLSAVVQLNGFELHVGERSDGESVLFICRLGVIVESFSSIADFEDFYTARASGAH